MNRVPTEEQAHETLACFVAGLVTLGVTFAEGTTALAEDGSSFTVRA